MSTTTTRQISFVENMVLALENSLWGILHRVVIGYFMMPAYHRLVGEKEAPWKMFAFFLAVLVALRIVPGILRRLLPFSREIQIVWADRRALARRYDSYQWRKLFGLGLGWLTYVLVSGEGWIVARFLACACLASGALGFMIWHRQSKRLTAQASAAAPAPLSA